MLVLTRRIGETIFINDNIEVTVLGVSGSNVKMGFTAPPEIKIHRKEIRERIIKELERTAK